MGLMISLEKRKVGLESKMGKTNSNSITAILVNKLNYKKSGFRATILKQWELPDDIFFYDGTHSTINISGINGKKPDIIGNSGGKTYVLIEVKVNLKEDLQQSQKEGKEYECSVNKNENLKLIYIIPDGYTHSDELPKESKKIQIVSWSKIYEIAKENDNTGFTEQIDYFVESQFHTNDSLLSKGDVAMFLSPSIIGQVNSLYNRIEKLMEEFSEKDSSPIKKQSNSNCHQDFGWWYDFKHGEKPKSVWIGIGAVEKSESSFFMCVWDKESNFELKGEKDEDYFLESVEGGSDIYIPITDENNEIPEFLYSETVDDQQEKFNELMSSNIEKLLRMLGKK